MRMEVTLLYRKQETGLLTGHLAAIWKFGQWAEYLGS